MRFLQPSQLAWSLVALVPLLLYLFRRKPRRVPVSSLAFFKSLAREHQESEWLRRLKRLLSFLLTLLVIAGAVSALARLVVSPAAAEVASIVVLIDRSASMAAEDPHGESRLAAAIGRVRERLAGVPGAVPVMLIAFDRRTEILVPRTFDRRLIERALAALTVRPMEGDAASALEFATQVAALELPAAIWFASDAPAPDLADVPAPAPAAASAPGAVPERVSVSSLAVPLAAPRNAGITAFDVRRLPLETGRYEAFVQLAAVGLDGVETRLEVRMDDNLTAVRQLTLAPGARENLLLPIEALRGRVLSLRVLAPGDGLAADDEVFARLPDPRPVEVLWVSPEPDPFTQLALAAIAGDGQIAVMRATPDAWPPAHTIDAVIFQKWLPPEWPRDLAAIVIDPPAPAGPVQLSRLSGSGVPVENLRATRERHPILYGVATGRLALTQTAVLAAEGVLEPLWTGPAGPLLAAGEARGQRVVVFAFAPELSENLPLSASYPLLLGNAIHWAAQPKADKLGVRTLRTGDSLAADGSSLAWLNPAGDEIGRNPVRNGWAALDRVGLWKTGNGETGSAALLSARETTLEQADADSVAGSRGAAVEKSKRKSHWLRGDLTVSLLTLVFVALLVESWLFHRHAVY